MGGRRLPLALALALGHGQRALEHRNHVLDCVCFGGTRFVAAAAAPECINIKLKL